MIYIIISSFQDNTLNLLSPWV